MTTMSKIEIPVEARPKFARVLNHDRRREILHLLTPARFLDLYTADISA
jgi:hypothetical protein